MACLPLFYLFRIRFSSSFVLVFALLLCSLPIFWGFAFVVLCLSSLPVLFVLVCLWVFVFSFSLAVYMQKKGRKVFLRPLLSCCGLLYLRIAAAFLSATAAAIWHSWSDPKNGGICGNSGINTIKQSFKGCFSIFANLNDFITWKFRIYLHPSEPRTRMAASGANIFQSYFLSPFRFICSVPL